MDSKLNAEVKTPKKMSCFLLYLTVVLQFWGVYLKLEVLQKGQSTDFNANPINGFYNEEFAWNQPQIKDIFGRDSKNLSGYIYGISLFLRCCDSLRYN